MTRSRTTYANVTATLALLVALSGTAYAAGLPKHSVGTKQLKKNAVTSLIVKDGTVTSADVADQSVEPADLSAASRALAAAGPTSPPSPTLLSGGVHQMPVGSGPITRFGPVSGHSAVSSAVTDVAVLSPGRPATVGTFRVRLGPGGWTDMRLDVMSSPAPADDAGAVTLLSCTITVFDARTCASDATAAVPPGSFLFVRVVSHPSGGGGESGILPVIAYSMSLTPSS